jgi:predicted ATP-grasp superfamily ATP-dependent carboligase
MRPSLFHNREDSAITEPPAVIMGLFYGSLQVARSLGSKGIEVYGIDRCNNPIGSYSRHVRVLDAPTDDDALARYLVELSGRMGSAPVLIPTSDHYARFLILHAGELDGSCRFTVPASSRLNDLVSKIGAHEVLSSLHIGTPVTMRLDRTAIERVPGAMRFPCILKPEFHDSWLEDDEVMKHIGPGSKVVMVYGYQELLERYAQLSGFGELVLQEFVPGDSSSLYYYVGYRSREGKILVSHVANKVRTYPDRLGSETVLRSVFRRDLLEMGDNILHKLDYVGPAGIDLKYDSRDGAFKVIEINCRLGLNDCYLTKHGLDIPNIYYRDSLGREVKPVKHYPDGITWYSFASDLDWMRQYGRSQGTTWASWAWQLLRGYDTYEVFCWSDPLPFAVCLRELAVRVLNKYGIYRTAGQKAGIARFPDGKLKA